ncbi:MAG: hypothetical protein SAK29_07900 [Scytonema sp. PMC 1069.18]|nr:hypothetical protein [Scytonema sp. PMC 1069.18]MEC4883323.1 hypothetical protein [Scytonema sp. PMC 1070.18]
MVNHAHIYECDRTPDSYLDSGSDILGGLLLLMPVFNIMFAYIP